MKTKKGRGKKIMIIAAIIIGVIALLMLIGFIVNSIKSKGELEKIESYGKLVDVNGSNMHVYSMGSGEKTIVLLPGLGVALPSADFGPLMRELSEKYTVVALDYFGVGFSDEVDTPRTNENYTEEIRIALDNAGFAPPYVLMPHSASGIYCEYYATKYPDEVESIILMDSTSTSSYEVQNAPKQPKWIYNIAKFQQKIGVMRLNACLIPETKKAENGYTQKGIDDYKVFSCHVINDTWIDQASRLMDNIKEVSEMDFPHDIPVLKIIASDTIDNMAKRTKGDGMAYQERHLKRLGENVTYKTVEATHFIYQTIVTEIVTITNEFLQ